MHPLDCHAVLFCADPKDERPARVLERSLGWNNLFSRGLEIVQVSGGHFTMTRQKPHDQVLAREMSEVLSRL